MKSVQSVAQQKKSVASVQSVAQKKIREIRAIRGPTKNPWHPCNPWLKKKPVASVKSVAQQKNPWLNKKSVAIIAAGNP